MLLYFMLGIIFITLGYPLIENVSSIFQAITQYIVYKYALKIYKIKKEMGQDSQIEVQKEDNHIPIGFRSTVEAIGYELPSEEELEEDD